MEKAVLFDPAVYPTDAVIRSHIGDHLELWHAWQRRTLEAFPGCEGIWKYYNDGKSWLFRFLLKKKTLCWASLFENSFRVTFYFTDKAVSLIEDSSLPEPLKESFRSGKYYGRIRGITLTVQEDSDVDHILLLTSIRIKVL
jgi:hypothetical protein